MNDKRLKDLRYTIYYKMSASVALNKVFYNDISNIILDYIIVNPRRVRYNKKVALNQFMGRWKMYKNILKGHNIKAILTSKMYFDHLEYMGFGKRFKMRTTFKLK
jgi:hypothetical protein